MFWLRFLLRKKCQVLLGWKSLCGRLAQNWMRVVAPQEAMVCGWVGCGPFEWCDGLIYIYH